ncbi:MAG: multidrug efflux RND transporter permease subunit [Acidobacteria bacterium]|nr:multidrug efflux RND transporter permease subunit [Acidobacteriota bacterium]
MAKFFINRPIVAMVISIVIVLAGVVSLGGLPVAQYPDIVPPEILVSAFFTGADCQTLEQAVATPLEQQINGVDNMLYVRSTNGNDGSMALTVDFAVGTDVNTDQVLTQNRASQATASLPEDVKAYGVTVQKSTSTLLFIYSLYSPDNVYDRLFLSNYAYINLNDALLRVPGVSQVSVLGASPYAMRGWLDPGKLARLNLTIEDVVSAVKEQNNANPAGQIGTEPAPPGQQFTYSVRAQGRLVQAEEFGEVVIRANPDGSMVRLKDVARLELGAQFYNTVGRYNGAPAALVAVYQAPGSNALEVAAGVKQAMADLEKRFPPGLKAVLSLDTTLAVSSGIEEIVVTLLEAMVLVILVVYLFLQSWRATLIPLLTVPVSLVGTFMVFPLLGFSINTLTLFGMVLAVGLVVDDAIVVVEAVEAHMERGLDRKAATLKAMEEVTSPVVAVALILAAVFVPVAFMGGITGRLYQQFALTIAISVLISAFNALTLSPALCSLLLKHRGDKGKKSLLGRFFGGFNRVFDRAVDGYVGISRFLVRRTVRTFLLLLAMTGGMLFIGAKLPGGFVPDEDQGYFFLNVSLPEAASLQRTDALMRKVEQVLEKTPGIEGYTTISGFSLLSGVSSTFTGFAFVTLKPWDDRRGPGEDAKSILNGLNRKLSSLPEAMVFGFLPAAIPGVGKSGGFSFMLQDRSGGDVKFLADNVDKFLDAARKRPELANVSTMFRAEVPQLYADVDRPKCAKLGVDVGSVYLTLQTFLGGCYVNDFNRFGRQWKVYLQGAPDDRVRREDIGKFFVRAGDGTTVPLSSVVTIRETNGPEFTNRFNLFRAAEINGSAAPGYSSGQAMNALEEVANTVLPREMGYDWSGMSYQERKAPASAGVFALSLAFVFLILAAQYESWSLPFSVLLGTPVAVLGAFVGLLSRRLENDVFAQVGLVMLVGLAAKNAILMVEFCKAELEKGRPLVDAALAGARARLRPILMTSFAFVLGCVPLWVAQGSGAISRQILGTVVIAGMLASTLIGIFVVPVLFVLVESLAHRRGKAPAPPAEPGNPVPAPPGGEAQCPPAE